MAVWYGVDIGGTSVKTALVDEHGKLLATRAFETNSHPQPEWMVEEIRLSLQTLAQEAGIDVHEVKAVGVGVPGFLDLDTGVVDQAVNLHWVNVPLVEMLSNALNIPVALDNDANVAALGEAWAGAGAGYEAVVCVTIGTGVGGGIILNGAIHHGVSGMGGEIGHMVVMRDHGPQCNCGLHGCLETVASATAMVREGRSAQAAGLLPADVEIRGAKDIFDLADAGHEAAKQVIADAADWLGYGLSIIGIMLNPDAFVIGGGVSKAEEHFLQPVREAFERMSLKRVREAVTIRAAALSNDAGVIGAARLAQQRADQRSDLSV